MVNRRSVRKRSTEVILVNNAMTGETLGRVGNLSSDGMMLIGPAALGDDCLYQVQFQLRDQHHVPQRLEVGIQCLWSEAARTERTYWAGCKIIDISKNEQRTLDQWLERAEAIAHE